jgi:5-methylcytosine-specific restriction endonuclease McrA
MHHKRYETAEARRKRLSIPANHCTWCGVATVKPRRSWCSNECLEKFDSVNNPAYIGRLVKKRDNGVCAICGNDTAEFEKLRASFLSMRIPEHCRRAKPLKSKSSYVKKCSCFFCVAARECARLGTWEADHIIPVVEGGGLCGLDNYRTLCQWCHAKETANLNRRLKADRVVR